MPRAITKWDELECFWDHASRDWDDNGKCVFTGVFVARAMSVSIYLMIAGLWILFHHLSI